MAEVQKSKSLRFSLRSLLVFAIVVALFIAAWSVKYRETQRTATATPAFKLTNLPAEVTVKQRSTTAIPGSDGKLLLTIEDITRGHVVTSLATASGDVVLPPRSITSAEAVGFTSAKSFYSLKLKQLHNALIGEDFATFIISESSDTSLIEKNKIEQLISRVAGLEGAKFIRNGAEYSAREAADHLRMKWRAAGAAIETADQFVEDIASKSSTSGEPYQIRMPDGTIIEAEPYLRRQLDEIE